MRPFLRSVRSIPNDVHSQGRAEIFILQKQAHIRVDGMNINRESNVPDTYTSSVIFKHFREPGHVPTTRSDR